MYLTAAFLIVRNAPRDRWNAIFLFVFGSMQWTEAYLWYVDQTEGLANLTANNRLGTMASFAVVMFEPFSSLLGRAYHQGKLPSSRELFVYVLLFGFLPSKYPIVSFLNVSSYYSAFSN